MFSFLIRLQRRLKRLLKVQTASRQKEVVGPQSLIRKGIVIALCAIVLGAFYPAGDLSAPLDLPREGDIAADDFVAPRTITLNKTDRQLRAERELITERTPLVLDVDSTVEPGALADLQGLADRVQTYQLAADSIPLDSTLNLLVVQFPHFSERALRQFLLDTAALRHVAPLGRLLQHHFYAPGMIRSRSDIDQVDRQLLVIRRGNRESVLTEPVNDLATAHGLLLTLANQAAAADQLDAELLYQLGRGLLRPNLVINRQEYESRLQNLLARITPIDTTIQAGAVIVRARERVTDQQERILQELARLELARSSALNPIAPYLPVIGRVALIGLLLGGMVLSLALFRYDVFASNPKLLALVLILMTQFFLIALTRYLGQELEISSHYLLPVAVMPVLVTILFDLEIGLLSTLLLAMLVGLLHRFAFPPVLVTVLVGVVACFAARKVVRRSDAYRILLQVILVSVAVIAIIESLRLAPTDELLSELAAGAVVGIISLPIAFFLLPFFESMFGFTSDIRLLELSDLNHPLLRRLSLEAPGTYHHSISVGNLCEAAAEAIGSNPLLARVGAYYHDIGKMEIPEYFVENQLGVRSRHDGLSPTMSALILASHVKKGRAIGEEADIPDDVLNFIEEHHGTMVMQYFYNKALQSGIEQISEDEFRYPGPRPQSRETGIAMLADAVEASSRTLDDPKPARIEHLIQKIIDDRFQSGQLDECPLTLKDLARIRDAFTQILIASFHQRLVYPKGQQPE